MAMIAVYRSRKISVIRLDSSELSSDNSTSDRFRELDSEELKVYRKALRIADTDFWKLYALDTAGPKKTLMKATSKSKVVVTAAENVYEIVVYSGKDFDALQSNLYPPLKDGEVAEITVNPNNDQVYILIWTLGNFKAEIVDSTSNNVGGTVLEPEDIDSEPIIDYSMDHVDAMMRVLYSSRVKEEIQQDDSDIIGPYKIGSSFAFEIAPSESVVCVGYGLKPVVNWNIASDPVMKHIVVKLIDRPGSKVEFGPLACRLYEVVSP